MIDCSRYSNDELADFYNVVNRAIGCLLYDANMMVTSAKHNMSDRNPQYTVCWHDILYGNKRVGKLVRYVYKTRYVNDRHAAILARFVLDIETDDSVRESIIEFNVRIDSMSSSETDCKIARLKELAMLAQQMTVLNAL